MKRHLRKELTRINRERQRKFLLLFEHYGIEDKSDTKSLAWALALEHVKGFNIEQASSRRGAKLKWNGDRLFDLLRTVEAIKVQRPNFNDRRALETMVKKPPYSDQWKPTSRSHSTEQWIETLESRLHEAKKIQKLVDKHITTLDRLAADLRKK